MGPAKGPAFSCSCFTMAITSLSLCLNFDWEPPGLCSAVRTALNTLDLLLHVKTNITEIRQRASSLQKFDCVIITDFEPSIALHINQ